MRHSIMTQAMVIRELGNKQKIMFFRACNRLSLMSIMRILFLFGLCIELIVGCSQNNSSNQPEQTSLAQATNSRTVTDKLTSPLLTNLALDGKIAGDKTNAASVSSTLGLEKKNDSSANSADLFTVVIDAQSGQYAAVSGDGHVIAAKDKSGNPIWTNDVIAKFGNKLPAHSSGKIDSLEFIEGQIVIYVGVEFVCIDPQSGKITRLGAR